MSVVILHIVDGPDSGRLFRLTGDQITIGRNAENSIVLNDTGVSGVHTKIMRDAAGQFTIHDNASTNGTFLNGKELRAGDIRQNDKFRVGSTVFAFELAQERRIRSDGGDVALVDSTNRDESMLTLPEVDLSNISRDELERSVRRSLLLDRLDRMLSKLDGPSEGVKAVLDASLAAAGSPRGLILLVDERTGEMVPSAVRDLADPEGEVSFSKSLAFEVATSGKAHIDECLCAPIKTTSSTDGVIYLEPPEGDTLGPAHRRVVEAIARRAGDALSASRWRVDFELLFSSTMDAIMNTIQAKDVYTRGHSERVRHYSKLLAKELGLSGEDLYRVTLGAALHDIGKVGMPDSVLKHNTQPRLTPEQMAEVRKHPARGARILKDITFLKDIIPAAELHHEDWGGGGYPHGMEGEEIPLIARIVAVADTYDAITTDRPYQKGKSYEEGHGILRKIAGKRLEPDLVEAFISAWYRHRKGPVRRPRNTQQLPEKQLAQTRIPEVEPADLPDLDVDDDLSQIIEIG